MFTHLTSYSGFALRVYLGDAYTELGKCQIPHYAPRWDVLQIRTRRGPSRSRVAKRRKNNIANHVNPLIDGERERGSAGTGSR